MSSPGIACLCPASRKEFPLHTTESASPANGTAIDLAREKIVSVAVLVTFFLTAPAAAQDPAAVVPDWQPGDHGVEIRMLPGEGGRTAFETSYPIGGGRSGLGRALSRIANTVGLGGIALTARTATDNGMPDSHVELRVYLKDLYENMPASTSDLQLESYHLRLQRDGDLRIHSGDLREADYIGRLPLHDFVRLLNEPRVDGLFEGREIRIERNQLAALRDLVLRVASPGTALAPVQADDLPSVLPGEFVSAGLLARHGLHVTGRAAEGSDRDAVGWLIDLGEGEPGPFLIQPVIGLGTTRTEHDDWTPFAAVEDTVYLAAHDGLRRAVITGRASVEETGPGSLCRSERFHAEGWLYDIRALDGPLPRLTGWGQHSPALAVPVSEVRRFASSRLEGFELFSDQPGFEALQARAFAAMGETWGAAMRAARGDGGEHFENPLPTDELLTPSNIRVLRVQGEDGEVLFASVSLYESNHYRVPSTYWLYVIGADGTVLQAEKNQGLPVSVAREPQGRADLLIYHEGVARWSGVGYRFPTRVIEYDGCT
jgi:hypothetical protein